jgi:hypothetical protein
LRDRHRAVRHDERTGGLGSGEQRRERRMMDGIGDEHPAADQPRRHG